MKTQSFKGEYFMKIGILERRNLSVDCCLVSVVNSLDQLKKKKKQAKKKKKNSAWRIVKNLRFYSICKLKI